MKKSTKSLASHLDSTVSSKEDSNSAFTAQDNSENLQNSTCIRTISEGSDDATKIYNSSESTNVKSPRGDEEINKVDIKQVDSDTQHVIRKKFNRILNERGNEIRKNVDALGAAETINVLSNCSVNFNKDELLQLTSSKAKMAPIKTYVFDPTKNELLATDGISESREVKFKRAKRISEWSRTNIESSSLDMYEKIERKFKNKEQESFKNIHNTINKDIAPDITFAMKKYISSRKAKLSTISKAKFLKKEVEELSLQNLSAEENISSTCDFVEGPCESEAKTDPLSTPTESNNFDFIKNEHNENALVESKKYAVDKMVDESGVEDISGKVHASYNRLDLSRHNEKPDYASTNIPNRVSPEKCQNKQKKRLQIFKSVEPAFDGTVGTSDDGDEKSSNPKEIANTASTNSPELDHNTTHSKDEKPLPVVKKRGRKKKVNSNVPDIPVSKNSLPIIEKRRRKKKVNSNVSDTDVSVSNEVPKSFAFSRSGRRLKRVNYLDMINLKTSEHSLISLDESPIPKFRKNSMPRKRYTSDNHTELSSRINVASGDMHQVPVKKLKIRCNALDSMNVSEEFSKKNHDVVDRRCSKDDKSRSGSHSIASYSKDETSQRSTELLESTCNGKDNIEPVLPLDKQLCASASSTVVTSPINTNEENKRECTSYKKFEDNSCSNSDCQDSFDIKKPFDSDQGNQATSNISHGEEQGSASQIASLKVRYEAVIDFIKETSAVNKNSDEKEENMIHTCDDSNKDNKCNIDIQKQVPLESSDTSRNNLNDLPDCPGETGLTSQEEIKKPHHTGETVKMYKSLFLSSHLADTISDLHDKSPDIQEFKKRRGRKKKKLPETIKSAEDVTCAVCHQKVDSSKWDMHKLKFHNNLAWRIDEAPLDLTDQKLVMRILEQLTKQRKKLQCNRCNCGLKSVVGFLSHIATCGKTPEEIELMKEPCTKCEKRFLPASLTAHMYQSHGKPKTLTQNEENDLPKEERRAAARKALTVIQGDSSSQPVSDDENELPKAWFRIYAANLKAPNIKVLEKLISEKLNSEDYVDCLYEGCDVKCSSLDVTIHLRRCEMQPKAPYLCKLCLRILSGKQSMLKHLTDTHDVHAPIEKYGNNNKSSDPSDLERTRKETNVLAKKNISFHKTSYNRNKVILFPRAYEWTAEFYKEYMSKDKIFINEEQTSENTWLLLNPELLIKYLPTMSESCDIARLLYKGSIKSPNEEYTFKKFRLFETQLYPDGNYTIFCGGPICSLAWLPTPLDCTVDQILAVATLKDPDTVFVLNKNYDMSSVIQFWNFGKLTNASKNECKPRLTFGLIIDFGPVWHMEWCASGCYNPPVDSDDENNFRLGLLAVAGSDSFVYIFSVPSLNEPEDMLFYKASPRKKLSLSRGNHKLAEKFYASKVSWGKGSDNQFIAVGYTNGIVALFHLTTLHKDSTGSNILYPYSTFQAHLHAITGICLHHLNKPPRWLMSTSKDKLLKIWDLNNVNTPLTTVKRGPISDALWLNHWLGQVICYDEAASRYYMGSSYKSVRDAFGEALSTLPSSSTVTTLAVSEWLNCIMHGTQAGEILAVFPKHYSSLLDDKFMRPRKLLFGYTELIDKKKRVNKNVKSEKPKQSSMEEESSDNTASNQEEGSSQNRTDYSDFFYYHDIQEKYGLLFCDGSMDDYKGLCQQKDQVRDWNQMLDISGSEVHPLQSVTKLALSPNMQATSYYAAGYHAGFIRVTSIGFLNNDIKQQQL